jgi:PKD repeat protein
VTATVKITASALPTVTITPSGTPVADSPTTFTVAAAATAPATVRAISVDFGDGTVQTYGNTTSVAHTYRSPGSYTVTATVEDTNGGRSTGSTVVVVAASAPLVALTATSPVTVNGIVTFSVTVTQNTANVPVQSVLFEFGDGQSREVNSLSTTYSYPSPGTYATAATVRFTNGKTAKGLAQVRVN